jgi:hypothetical protein
MQKTFSGTSRLIAAFASALPLALSLVAFAASVSFGGTVDTTPPTITAVATPPPNANGWNRTNVTVKFVCADTESGIKTCPTAKIVSADGANQVVTAIAIDKAGNTATLSVTLNIDKTAPLVSAVRSPDANADGWTNGPIVVSFSATDALSGLAPGTLTAPITFATDARKTAIGHATDLAGNIGTVKLPGINIDLRAPVITATLSPAPSGNGFRNAPVTVHFTCTDPLSGIATCPPDQVFASDGKNQTVSGTATDKAGNSRTVTKSFSIDQTPPTITVALTPAPNAAGWNQSAVTGHFTCSDGGSGIAVCPPNQVISTEVASQLVAGTVKDRAGNTAAAVATVRIDMTPPVIAIATPGVVGTPNVTVTGTLTDALSGIASATFAGQPITVHADGTFSHGPVALTDGVNTFALTATDNAGHTRLEPWSVTREQPQQQCTNRVQDPGFESGVSGFYAQDARNHVTQNGVAPLEGSHSLRVEINSWGDNVWWDHAFGGTASRLRVSAHFRSDLASSSKLKLCAAAYYADDTGNIVLHCTDVPGTIGDKGVIDAVLELDSARALHTVNILMFQEGSQPLQLTIDEAIACLDVVTDDGGGGGDGGGGDGGGGGEEPPPPPPPPGCPAAGGNPDESASGPFADGVTVHLTRTFAGGDRISFGVPVPPGVHLTDVSTTRVLRLGAPLDASVREILAFQDRCGARTAIRAVQIQFDASLMTGNEMDVDVVWRGTTGAAPGTTMVPYGDDRVSIAAPETVNTTVRTIASVGGVNTLVEAPPVLKTLFTAREPHVLATFPDSYLASTGILGQQVTSAEAHQPQFGGLAFLSDAMSAFALSSMYDLGYALNPDPESVVDPVVNFEGWLYDRCTTYLTAFVHTNDARFLREAYRSCRYYASKINLTGADRGIFSGKPDPDAKYSHLRGLYAYYALTGDELALDAGTAIADLWYADPIFVLPYRAGHTRGSDRIWTERLLGTSFEGLYYGHRLTGQSKYLYAFDQMFDTAYRHITGDATALAAINPGIPVAFPPQNCFIHTAEQHSEGNGDQPWCSIWMSELTIDALLRYEEQTGDARASEVFVRLARYLRDVGSAYFNSGNDNNLDDTFMNPSIPYDAAAGENIRRLVPLYGSGLGPDLVRRNFGEYEDFLHCTDATALTAVALRALKVHGGYDENPIGPFASEGASILQLHHEFAACAKLTFVGDTRSRRDPRVWTSAQLAPGVGNPATFIRQNKIGYPVGNLSPQRKLSWWFNMSMLQFGLLTEAGITVPVLTPGIIQP